MGHKISIDFTGLCVFATKNVPKRLSVLLVKDTMKGMQHRPLLSFNVRNLEIFRGTSTVEVIQLPNGDQIASLPLDSKIVTLSAGKSALPNKVTLLGAGATDRRLPRDPQDEMNLCWVPSLGKITGQDVDPTFLDTNPVRHHGHSVLAARIDIDRGFLFANAAVNRQQPAECWTIKTLSGPPLEQYLADTVRLEIDVPLGEFLTISATPFDGGLPETLELSPVNETIAFSITNLPEVLPNHNMAMKTMDHFAAYYAVLDKPPKEHPVPTLPGATPSPVEGHMAHHMGPDTARAEGVFPVKCSPGMVP